MQEVRMSVATCILFSVVRHPAPHPTTHHAHSNNHTDAGVQVMAPIIMFEQGLAAAEDRGGGWHNAIVPLILLMVCTSCVCSPK